MYNFLDDVTNPRFICVVSWQVRLLLCDFNMKFTLKIGSSVLKGCCCTAEMANSLVTLKSVLDWIQWKNRCNWTDLQQISLVLYFKIEGSVFHLVCVNCLLQKFFVVQIIVSDSFSSQEIIWYICYRLKLGSRCSLWTVLDPFLLSLIWTPVSTLLNVVIICLYIKVACIAWQRQRQRPAISNEMIQKAHIKSQSKTTNSLLMVLGIFTSTYTIWLITYYCTVDKYTDTIELIQTLTEWLWQVCTNHFYWSQFSTFHVRTA